MDEIMNSCWNWRLCLAAICLAAAGCGAPDAKFVRYSTFARVAEKAAGYEKQGFTEQQKQNVDDILAALYGSPDAPTLPALPNADITKVVDLSKLKLAAGRVGSDETGRPRGLYRKHCAHCHGITGDGNGPTASFLNPYPRDYRAGLFKFKSTPIGRHPLHEDLKRIVIDGIPGTAMPSFRLLSDPEIESLVDYVKYLSIRGETERQLYNSLGELDEKELLTAPLMDVVKKDLAEANEGKEPTAKALEEKVKELSTQKIEAIKSFADDVVQKWLDPIDLMAQDTAKVSSRNDALKALREELVAAGTDEKKLSDDLVLKESELRGRKLFYGPIANCFS
jgi:mono/diheme cytochrome c family protein